MYLDKAVEFLTSIKSTDNVVIIFNNDGDGICSCALVKKLLEKKGVEPYIISQPMPPDKFLNKRLQTTLPTKIIFLDMAVDQQPHIVKKFSSICDILIIDHHSIHKNMNSRNVVHYNPRFNGKSIYQSTTYCAYKICSKIENFSEHLWITAIGMVSDYNLDDSQDIVGEAAKKYGVDKKLYKSIFGRLADMIAYTRATKLMTCEEMVHLFGSTSFENLEKAKNYDKLLQSFQMVDNEINEIIDDAEKNAEKIGNLVLYNIKSRHGLSSFISTRLSEKYHSKVVIIYEKNKTVMKVSARNQAKKYDVGRLLQKALSGIDGSAGGHEAAAGATMHAKDWEKFKEQLIQLVG